MAPGVVLDRCRAEGVTVTADGGSLRLSGPAAGRDAVRAILLANKPDVLALLTAPSCPECGNKTDEKHRCWGCHDRPCAGCGRPTGSAFLATCTPCGIALREE